MSSHTGFWYPDMQGNAYTSDISPSQRTVIATFSCIDSYQVTVPTTVRFLSDHPLAETIAIEALTK